MDQIRAKRITKKVLDWLAIDNREGGRLGRNVIMQRCLNQEGIQSPEWATAWKQVTILVDRELRKEEEAAEAFSAVDEAEIPAFVDDGEPIDYIPTPDGHSGVLVEVIGTTSRAALSFRKRHGRIEIASEHVVMPSHVIDAARRVATAHLTRS